MKKKDRDAGKTSELLRKLQEAVLSSHKKEEPAEEPDSDELAFQKKIAEMLNRATPSETESKTKKKPSKPKKESAATEKAISEHLSADQPPETDASDEASKSSAPVPQPAPPPLKPSKAKSRPKKERANKAIKQEITEEAEETPTTPITDVPTDVPTDESPNESLQTDSEQFSEEATEVVEVFARDETEVISESADGSAELSTEQQQETAPDEDSEAPVPETTEEPIPWRSEPQEEPPTEEIAESAVIPEEPAQAPQSAAFSDDPVFSAEEEREAIEEPKQAAPTAPRKTAMRITPAKAPPRQPQPRDPNTIVITPKTNLKSTVPIVIKPQRLERTADPIRVEVKHPMPKAPIKVSPPKTESKPAEPAKQTPQKAAPSASAQSTRTAAGVSAPRRAQPHVGTVKSRGVKKHHPHPAPAHQPSVREDEGFDIVLESVLSENTVSEAAISQEAGADSLRSNGGSNTRSAHFASTLTVEEILKYTEKRTGMTPDDVSMIFELGYENELGHLIGQDALKKLKAEHIRSTRPADKLRYRTSFGYRNQEYTGKESRDAVLANYVHDKKTLILRLALTALITLLLVPMELSHLFGGVWQEIRLAQPLLYPLLGLLGLAAAGALSLKFILAGIQSFFRFSPTPYSAVGLLFPLAAAVGTANLFLTGENLQLISLNLPTVSLLLLIAVCDALRLSSEMRVFRILSAEDEKTVLEPAETHKQKLRHGDKIVKIINDDLDQNLYRPRKSELVSGFFRRCSDTSSAARPFGFLLLATLTLCFVTGLIATVLGNGFQTVASAVLLTFFFSLPIPSVLLFFYPLCRANRLLCHRNCALVGEESVAEYGQPKTVIFRDRDLFTLNKYTQTMVREGEDFRRDIRLAGILFRKMKGALDELDPNSASSVNDPPVTLVRLGENGTEAIVDNHYHLLAGNAQFLTKSGVRVPKESTDRREGRNENARLMYVAIDGVLKLTYEIEYTASPAFEAMISLLAEHGTYSAIRTYDPNINDEFLQACGVAGAEYVRVIKPVKYESEDTVEVSDSGAVALGDRFDVTRPTVAASLIQKIRSVGYRVQLAATAAGAALGLILALRQSELLAGVPVLLAMLFQGGLLFAAWLATRLTFRWNTPDNFK